MIPVFVDRLDFKRALDLVSKLSGKSLGFDGLVTLRLTATEVSIASHGNPRVQWATECEPANDGLGTATVQAEYLRAVLRELPGSTVALGVRLGSLLIGSKPCWTVNVSAVPHVAVPRTTYDSRRLSDLLKRAASFACSDSARPNLVNVHVAVRSSDCWLVQASDGHSAFQERFIPPDELSTLASLGSFGIHGPVIKLAKKRTIRLAHGESLVWVNFGPYSLGVDQGKLATFPPVSQVIASANESATCSVTLEPDVWLAWLGWLENEDENVRLHFGPSGAVRCVIDEETAVFGDESSLLPVDEMKPDARPAWAADRAVFSDYLRKALEVFDTEHDLLVKFTSSRDPLLFTQGDRRAVVMPRRI